MGLTARVDGRASAEAAAASGWASAPAAERLRVARALVPVVLGWLREGDPAALYGALAEMPPDWHPALRRLLTTQGLAPLVADVAAAGSGPSVERAAASETAGWLATQLEQNRARMGAFAEDLGAILAGAAAAGVPVMPLKGGLLAFTRYREPGLRPMADLDLLVHAADEPGLHDVLARLGYAPVDAAVARHRTFGRPGERVVALDGTHPGNPRTVEVHTRLQKTVWLDRGGVDLAPSLWSHAREDEVLGQPAVVPSDAALLDDLASHATLHLVRGGGMLLHWLDVARVAAGVGSIDEALSAWTYPALALAARAFPGRDLSAKVEALEPRVGSALARLAARAPLDDRSGLNLAGVDINALPWLASHWLRWRPNPWLAGVAYPHLPAPVAYAAYLAGVGVRAARKAVQHALRRGG